MARAVYRCEGEVWHWSRRGAQQRSSGTEVSAALWYPLRARAREDGQEEAGTRAGRLAALLQRAAGFLSRQAFLGALAHWCGLPDAWFRQFACGDVSKIAKRVFCRGVHISLSMF